MAIASWRPDIAVQVAFNAAPNDPAATPSFSDLTSVFRAAAGVQRGRQYELDQNQASQPTLVFWDQNEYLNPANPASPYAPGVVPYRQLLWQAMWPNGGTGNLLNAGMQGDVIDPTFESYVTGTRPTWVLTVGPVSPQVSTITPQQGSKDLLWVVLAAGGEQGIGLTVTCIPGRQYTTSIYVRQTGANTAVIFVNGGAGGTSTTTTGAYVRLSVTFTASQPTHQIWVVNFAPTVNSTVTIDAIQHEAAATASTFTTSGPVIYGVLRGYVERWPSSWNHMGFAGEAAVIGVDAYAPLNQITLATEYQDAVLASGPLYYWRLSEPQGSTTFADATGNGPPLTALVGPVGPGVFTPGSQMDIPGDPGSTGVICNTGNATTGFPSTVMQTGTPPAQSTIQFGAAAPPMSWTFAMWMAHTIENLAGNTEWCVNIFNSVSNLTLLEITGKGGPARLIFGAEGPGTIEILTVTDAWTDAVPHLYVVTSTVTATTLSLIVYVDGTAVASGSTPLLLPFTTPFYFDAIQVGGFIFQHVPGRSLANGVYEGVAYWSRALSSGEVATLWTAGQGNPGETSGQRVARYLTVGDWNGLRQIDTGQSIMGVSDLSAGTSLLQACQDVTTSENGDFWVDSLGQVTFASRTRRYLETTSLYTFGERTDLGEYPYEGDIAFDFDPTLVYNAVEVDNADGFRATVTNAASQQQYFPRGYQRDVNLLDDDEVVDAATYLLAQHKDPHLRVNTITLNPAATPALWPVVLSLEIGQRVTVKRRASAANNGAGLTIAADFFVENISHDSIDMGACTWTTTLYLSPVDLSQVGILNDSTYGQLGSGGAVLHSSITSSATTATVDSTSGGDLFALSPAYTTTIEQEIVTVTSAASAMTDTFARTVANGWGTATTGGAWTAVGGAASDYSVAPSLGRHTLTSVNVARETFIGTGFTYAEDLFTVQTSVIATGAELIGAWTCRRVDASNLYRFEVAYQVGALGVGGVTIRIRKIVAGVSTILGAAAHVLRPYAANTPIHVRTQAVGSTLRMRVWSGATEPLGQWQVSVTDSTFATGAVGFLSLAATGSTNVTPGISYGAVALVNPQILTITRPADGTATAHNAASAVQTYQPFVLAY